MKLNLEHNQSQDSRKMFGRRHLGKNQHSLLSQGFFLTEQAYEPIKLTGKMFNAKKKQIFKHILIYFKSLIYPKRKHKQHTRLKKALKKKRKGKLIIKKQKAWNKILTNGE